MAYHTKKEALGIATCANGIIEGDSLEDCINTKCFDFRPINKDYVLQQTIQLRNHQNHTIKTSFNQLTLLSGDLGFDGNNMYSQTRQQVSELTTEATFCMIMKNS